jgi:tyrosyl-tRNA synthetase
MKRKRKVVSIDVHVEDALKMSVVTALAKLNLTTSSSEARRLIGQRAVRINNVRVDEIDETLPAVQPGSEMLIMLGTTKSGIVRVID